MEYLSLLRMTTEQIDNRIKRDIEKRIKMEINWDTIQTVKTTLNDYEIEKLNAEKMEDTTEGTLKMRTRGMLAERAIEYRLKGEKLVYDRHEPIDKNSDLRDIVGIGLPEFRLKTKRLTEKALEVKSCPEILTKRGDPYKLALVEGDEFNADYLIAVKILEFNEDEKAARLGIWGYMTKSTLLTKVDLEDENYYLFKKTGTGRAADLTNWELWSPISELWEILKKACLTWNQ